MADAFFVHGVNRAFRSPERSSPLHLQAGTADRVFRKAAICAILHLDNSGFAGGRRMKLFRKQDKEEKDNDSMVLIIDIRVDDNALWSTPSPTHN